MSEEKKEKEDKKESKSKGKRNVLTEDKPGHLSQDEFGDPEYPDHSEKKKDDEDDDKKESEDS